MKRLPNPADASIPEFAPVNPGEYRLLVVGDISLDPVFESIVPRRIFRIPDLGAAVCIIRREPPSTIVLLDPFGPGGTLIPAIRQLIRAAPSVPIAAALSFDDASEPVLRTLAEWGVSTVVNSGPHWPEEDRVEQLMMAHGRPLKRRMEPEVLPFGVNALASRLLSAAIDVVVDRSDVVALRIRLRVPRKKLAAMCRNAGIPPPGRVISWVRVLLASILLEEAHQTADHAALCAGMPNAAALRRQQRRLLGITGAATFSHAFAQFKSELRSRGAIQGTARPGRSRD